MVAVKSWLECRKCGERAAESPVTVWCATCQGELVVRYGPPSGSSKIIIGQGVFRFGARLPINGPSKAVTLGEGGTPLIGLYGKTCARLALPPSG